MKVLCKLNNLKYFSDEDLLVRLTQYIRMPDGEINCKRPLNPTLSNSLIPR